MYGMLAFLNLVSVATFAGGCLCLSVTLSGLLGRPALDAAQVMQTLLPRMGAVMAPLLLCALFSAGVSAWAAARGSLGSPQGPWFMATTIAFAAIAVVTALVHLPLNAQFLATEPLAPVRAAELLQRWLGWHHVRTVLAVAALASLLWPVSHKLVGA